MTAAANAAAGGKPKRRHGRPRPEKPPPPAEDAVLQRQALWDAYFALPGPCERSTDGGRRLRALERIRRLDET